MTIAGIVSLNSDSADEVGVMTDAESNDSFDMRKALLGMTIIGFVAVAGSIGGCYGTAMEIRPAICGFSCFLLILGLIFTAIFISMIVFMAAEAPLLVKETNRICRKSVITKLLLKCKHIPTNAIGPNTALAMSTPQPTAPPFQQAAVGGAGRRLRSLGRVGQGVVTWLATASMQLLEPHIDSVHHLSASIVKTFEPDAYVLPKPSKGLYATSLNLSFVRPRGITGEASFVYSVISELRKGRTAKGRRLKPGDNEINFLQSVCDRMKNEHGELYCRDECDLVDKLCKPPEGFEEDTACVCDAKGPRKLQDDANMFSGSLAGQTGLNYVQAECPGAMLNVQGTEVGGVCRGDGCSLIPGTDDEGCYALASTDCRKWAELLNTEVSTPFSDKPNVYWSTGACKHPDPRSRVIDRGLRILLGFITALGFLALFMSLSSLCGCCLFFEIHTGKKVHQAVRGAVMDDDEEDYDEEDVDDE